MIFFNFYKYPNIKYIIGIFDLISILFLYSIVIHPIIHHKIMIAGVVVSILLYIFLFLIIIYLMNRDALDIEYDVIISNLYKKIIPFYIKSSSVGFNRSNHVLHFDKCKYKIFSFISKEDSYSDTKLVFPHISHINIKVRNSLLEAILVSDCLYDFMEKYNCKFSCRDKKIIMKRSDIDMDDDDIKKYTNNSSFGIRIQVPNNKKTIAEFKLLVV